MQYEINFSKRLQVKFRFMLQKKYRNKSPIIEQVLWPSRIETDQ